MKINKSKYQLQIKDGKIVDKRIRLPKCTKVVDEKTKYQRFLELCKLCVKYEDIKPDFVCYSSKNVKVTIIDVPFISKYTGSLFVDTLVTYEEDNTSYPSHMSLNDRNIIGGGYNLHRVFKNKDHAIEYKAIVDDYSYYGRDRWGDTELQYTITPIAGPDMDIDPTKYKVK